MSKPSSKLLSDAVDALATLPSIGRKTALRLALHILRQDETYTHRLTSSLDTLRQNIKKCSVCFNLSDEEVCAICSNPLRKGEVVCVVESFKDVLAIEETGHFRGKYHVLGGVISPIEGIGPAQLNLQELFDRVSAQGINELILAVNPSIDGDTTNFYIAKRLKDNDVKVSVLARGVAYGGELQYADELTLSHSIYARRPYQLEKFTDE